jgi:hypothetical protein
MVFLELDSEKVSEQPFVSDVQAFHFQVNKEFVKMVLFENTPRSSIYKKKL